MRLIISLLLLSFPLFLSALEEEKTSFGYMRLQTSFDHPKENLCFKAPGANSKYRLGNECETWMELGLKESIYLDNGIKIHNQLRPIFMGANEQSIDFFDWGEAYTQISHPTHSDVKVWLGRKYFRRYDSHMTDYWYLNLNGFGAGVEDLHLPYVSLAYSFLVESLSTSLVNQATPTNLYSHDLRLIKEFKTLSFELFLNYMVLPSKVFNASYRIQDESGKAFGLRISQKNFLSSTFEKSSQAMAFFLGDGLAKSAGEYLPYLSQELKRDSLLDNLLQKKEIKAASSWRILHHSSIENSTFGLMSNFLYEHKDEQKYANSAQNWLSFGLRPYWFI
jgi:maltoporin